MVATILSNSGFTAGYVEQFEASEELKSLGYRYAPLIKYWDDRLWHQGFCGGTFKALVKPFNAPVLDVLEPEGYFDPYAQLIFIRLCKEDDFKPYPEPEKDLTAIRSLLRMSMQTGYEYELYATAETIALILLCSPMVKSFGMGYDTRIRDDPYPEVLLNRLESRKRYEPKPYLAINDIRINPLFNHPVLDNYSAAILHCITPHIKQFAILSPNHQQLTVVDGVKLQIPNV